MRQGMLLGILWIFVLVATPGFGQADDGYGRQFGWGMAAVGSNVFYMPTKVVYSMFGGLTGGLAYLLTVGNADVAQSIWSVTLGGTYVLTPDMVRGRDPILFFGESYRGTS